MTTTSAEYCRSWPTGSSLRDAGGPGPVVLVACILRHVCRAVKRRWLPAMEAVLFVLAATMGQSSQDRSAFDVREDADQIRIASPQLEAAVRKRGYVSGVAGGSFLDRKTGFRDAGFGLDIVDWLMEPGSDAAYRDHLPGDLPYDFNNLVHGKRAKRCIEGPQICTQAKEGAP